MKVQLLNMLSKVLNKIVSILILKKIVVLKAAFSSSPITSEIGRNISWKFRIKMLLFIY